MLKKCFICEREYEENVKTLFDICPDCTFSLETNIIRWKNEPRRYMGPKWARVPRGSIVNLIAVVKGKIGVFKYNEEVMWCPVRLLHRIKD